MKKRVLMAMALTLALLVSPIGSAGMSVLTASSNNTQTTTGNNSNAGNNNTSNSGNQTASGNNSSNTDNSNTGSSNTDSQTTSDTTPATVTASDGTTTTSNVMTMNDASLAVALTTSSASVNSAVDGLEDGQFVVLKVTNAQCSDAVQKVVDDAASSANATVATILDITLRLANEDGSLAKQITTLNTPVTFTIAAPTNVDGNTYDFAIIRIHDGVATILPDTDSDPATITFATDRFSTYAVVYGAKGSFDVYNTAVKDSVPKTGDTLPSATPFVATVLFVMAAITFKAFKKKEA